MTEEKLMTAAEAAEFLQMHPNTVTLMARRRQIPGQRVGRNWRFSRKRLEEMFADKGDKTKETQ